MRVQVCLLILCFITGNLQPVQCARHSNKFYQKMKTMEDDIMGIAPSLLRSPVGINNRARWPGNTIPYVFQYGYPESFKRLYQRAVQQIAERTCIRFVPRTNQKDYVEVVQDRGCYSYVGRLGRGAQPMSLPWGCNSLGTFVHEMLHAVGYDHEQNRFDRDDYVSILWRNIKPEKVNQFEINRMRLSSEYDYQSIMHYSQKSFTRNGRDTIVPKRRGVAIGQMQGMSRGDIEEVNDNFCS